MSLRFRLFRAVGGGTVELLAEMSWRSQSLEKGGTSGFILVATH